MNIVSIERILVIDILVLICTMIGMNYADPEISECMNKIDEMFATSDPHARGYGFVYDTYDAQVRFITRNITLADYANKYIERKFVRHVFNSVSQKTPRFVKNTVSFCSMYGNSSENCIDTLYANGIRRNATEEFILRHVYFNLKQEQGGEGYIYDLVQHVHDELQFVERDLFGILDTQIFCRLLRLTNTVRDDFPSHCHDFPTDDHYVLYTYLYINVNKLKPGLTKDFLVQLFFNTVSKTHYRDAMGKYGNCGEKEISKYPPNIHPESFCDYFGAVLNEVKNNMEQEGYVLNEDICNTKLAESIIEYCYEIGLQPGNFDRRTCSKEIKKLNIPVASFYETAQQIYFDMSIYEIYSKKDLNKTHKIKYADHYIRFIFNFTLLLEYKEEGSTKKKIVKTPEQFCVDNYEHYENLPKEKKGGLFSSLIRQ